MSSAHRPPARLSAPMSDDLQLTAGTRLAGADYRFTGSRRRLVDVLAAAGQPMSMPEILAQARLPQSSAYRNLTVLETAGVVRRVTTTDEFSRYELAEELTGHHHHLVCERCGLVEDFTLAKGLEKSLESAFEKSAAERGLSIAGHRVDVYGLCHDCQRSPG